MNTEINQETGINDGALTLDQSLRQAIAHHQAGQFQEAGELYLAILQTDPNHPEANHNMGVLAVQMKQPAAGLSYFTTALDADPACGQYWLSYIDALIQADQLEDARQILALARQQGLQGDEVAALAMRLEDGAQTAEHSDAEHPQPFKEPLPVSSGAPQDSQKTPNNQEINNLVSLFTQGRLTEAATLAQAMTLRFPLHEFGWKALGAIFKQLGRNADALAPMQQAVALSPGDVEAQYNLGVTLQELGRLNEAEASYRQALQINPGYADAHINLGAILHESGRLNEAEASYRQALQITPDSAKVYSNLGAILQESGRLNEAEACYRLALQVNPNNAETHYNLSITLKELGRLDEAEASCRQALQIKPDYAEAHYNLGNTLYGLDRQDEAEASYRQALKLNPNDAQAHNNLGSTLQKSGRLDEAKTSYRQALQINPDYAKAYNNLGSTLQELGQLDEAETIFRQALQINPNYAEAHYNLGITLKALGRLDEAEASYQQALLIDPNYTDALNNLGVLFKELGRPDEAEASLQRALQIKPDYADAHNNLGVALRGLGRLGDAEASLRRALQVKPDYAEAHSNLGVILRDMGRLDEAETSLRRALQIKPDYADAHSNLIFGQDLADTVDLPELYGERKKWDETHAAPLWKDTPHSNDRSPERRLRVGYVSGDFRDHSAARVFGGMLTRYDRSQFDVFAYSNFNGKADRFTDLFKQNVTVWRNIGSLPDEAVAKMIREDRIDILVDLSGHSAGNRLLVFARKPAPIQITAWGYATSTGMRAMDVFFTDPVMVPPQDKRYFTEDIRYLPSVVGSFFNEPFPDVNELPALTSGILTFGSLNRLVKVSENAYRAWAEILRAVPQSRLILKAGELNDASVRERVAGHFTKAGVTADRIVMQGKTSWHEHTQTYNQIDIALDPFPHGGGVTTLEGLMMGVPAITLRWPTTVGRLSASIMTTLGMTDWIAETPEQYVALAIQKSNDLQSLAALRQQLRGIFTASVIGDQAAYARAVEQEYRQLWREWCAVPQAVRYGTNKPG